MATRRVPHSEPESSFDSMCVETFYTPSRPSRFHDGANVAMLAKLFERYVE